MSENRAWANPPREPGTSVPWFREQLTRLGISLHPHASLASGLAALEDERVASGLRDYPDMDEVVPERLRIFGTDYLTKAVHHAHTLGWKGWEEKARMLKAGDPNPFFPAIRTMERDHSWELLIGAVCATFCTDVRFAEPDLVVEYSGVRVGIAAKVHYEGGTSRLEQSVRKGVKQVQSQFDADQMDCGVVLVNLASTWPHAKLLRGLVRNRVFDPVEIANMLDVQSSAHLADRNERMLAEYSRRSAFDASLLCIPTLAPIAFEWIWPFFYTALHSERANPRSDFAYAFHTAAQKVLKWNGTTGALEDPERDQDAT